MRDYFLHNQLKNFRPHFYEMPKDYKKPLGFNRLHFTFKIHSKHRSKKNYNKKFGDSLRERKSDFELL